MPMTWRPPPFANAPANENSNRTRGDYLTILGSRKSDLGPVPMARMTVANTVQGVLMTPDPTGRVNSQPAESGQKMPKHHIKAVGALAAAMTAIAGMALSTPTASANPAPPPLGTKKIVNYKSGKCLTLAGGGLDNNIHANQYDCDPDPSRLWNFR
jgi:hypothetical protein